MIISDVLFKPKHSLIKQSINAQEMDEPLNGDGFGLGWYAQNIGTTPALFRSIQPAWNDLNLQYLSEKIRSECFFAHIRSASEGGISLFNCHPFHYRNLLFMHNGDIVGFSKIKRYLRRGLEDPIYDWIQGQTDSEHFFALFLNRLDKSGLEFNADNAAKILQETIVELEEMKKKYEITGVSTLNVVITDGISMVASRYISGGSLKAKSLYYAAGDHYEFQDSKCHITPPKNGMNGAVLLVSERLTTYKANWHEVPSNHLLLVHKDRAVELRKIS